MNLSVAEHRLLELWGEIVDLEATEQVLEWDQETQMPPAGQEARGKVLATIAGLKHQRLTNPELQEVIAVCEEGAERGSLLAAQVRCARLDVDRAVRLPESLERAIAEAKSFGLSTWRRARAEANFAGFAPALERLLALRREEASTLRPGGNGYDARLHFYEPGATEAELVPLFAELRRELVPRVRAVVESGRMVDESPAQGLFAPATQEALGRRIAAAIGFDFAAGRLDLSTHPFCTGISTSDVRMTWRYQKDDFRPAFFGILHEMGHALYEQGLPAEHRRSPIGRVLSLGMHESQSRMWENLVGRSRGFWRWALPMVHEAFGGAGPRSVEALWPALHTVKPSLIRVEADEATYNLHIVVRFELERALFAGRLEVADLPAAWDDLYEELLGIRPTNAAEGVLQDIHWAQGMLGYFPTYTLGNLISCQLFAAARRELGELEPMFEQGELGPLLGWLRDKIHRHGSRLTTSELVEAVTGTPLGSADLLAYLSATCEEVYGVS